MNCPSRLPALKAIQARINSLRCLMQKVFVWTGWYKDTRPEYAPMQTRSFSAGKWSLTWISEPGRYYSVQESTDGGKTWITVAVAVKAADSPAKVTAWTGPAMPYLDAFFRVVVLPLDFRPCYTSLGIVNVPGYDPRTDPIASLS